MHRQWPIQARCPPPAYRARVARAVNPRGVFTREPESSGPGVRAAKPILLAGSASKPGRSLSKPRLPAAVPDRRKVLQKSGLKRNARDPAGRNTGVNLGVGRFRRRSKGSPTRARTWDPAVNSRLLYQLSYRGVSHHLLDGACVNPPLCWSCGRRMVAHSLIARHIYDNQAPAARQYSFRVAADC